MIKMPSRDGRSEAALCPMDKKSDPRLICLFITEEAGLSPPKPCFLRCFLLPQPAGRDSPVTACLLVRTGWESGLDKSATGGYNCSNQTAMKGKNAFVPLREPVVGANRRGGGADTGPGVARLRSVFHSRAGRLAPLTAVALLEAVSARRQRRAEPGWYRVRLLRP